MMSPDHHTVILLVIISHILWPQASLIASFSPTDRALLLWKMEMPALGADTLKVLKHKPLSKRALLSFDKHPQSEWLGKIELLTSPSKANPLPLCYAVIHCHELTGHSKYSPNRRLSPEFHRKPWQPDLNHGQLDGCLQREKPQ